MTTEQHRPKKLKGRIVSARTMQKTVVVAVDRYIKNRVYKKYMRRTKRYKAHDEHNHYDVGDRVVIQECRPLSKNKHFIVIEKIKNTDEKNTKPVID